jgi:predicted metal-dependent hydrolase
VNQNQNQSSNRNQKVRTVALFQSNKPDAVEDAEFGRIGIKRHANARSVRLRMNEDGTLVVTLPRFASLRHAEELIESSRSQIRTWRTSYVKKPIQLNDGDHIGQSHTIRFIPSPQSTTTVTTRELTITVKYPETLFHTDPNVQSALRPHLQKALQKEARAYLPRRLKHLATTYGFQYEKVRYGTQKGRWGSCSSRGTISLNVGLMLLDQDLIDYVLIHELCHTKQMNHSRDFWALVASCMPDYKARRKILKSQHPTL